MATSDFEHWVDEMLPLDPEARIGGASIKVLARDGLPLAGSLYAPLGEAAGTVALFSGTGIPRRYYDAFARYLASRGLAVLTLDYRGIGDSLQGLARGVQASKVDWGERDMPAALDALAERFPGRPRFAFGHSVGGQLLGLMDNAGDLDGVVTYAASFGYWGGMPSPYRYYVWSLWHVAFPALTKTFGYLPGKRLGLGMDLPRGVAEDWARWGKRADYFVPELGDRPGFAAIDAPWQALVATDDPIATPQNSDGLLALYPNAQLTVETLDPTVEGFEEIGHMGLVKRRCRALWARPADFLLGLAES